MLEGELTTVDLDETEAAQVRQIFELYLDHQSLLPTVTELNRRGWSTKRWMTKKSGHRGGRLFTKNSLHALLTNVTYIGQIRYKDEVHQSEHVGIVPPDLFQRVQTLLQRNGHTGGRAVRNKYGALLKGLIRCRACRCAMPHTYTAKGNKRYRYYVCGTAQQRGWSECPAPSIPAAEIERFVVEQIRGIGRVPVVIAETVQQVQQQMDEGRVRLTSERTALQRQVRDDHQALQMAATLTNPVERASWLAEVQERLRVAERRLTEIDDELARLDQSAISDDEVARSLADFDQVWQSLAPREQARMLELLIERVEYDGERSQVSLTFRPCGVRSLTHELQESAI